MAPLPDGDADAGVQGVRKPAAEIDHGSEVVTTPLQRWAMGNISGIVGAETLMDFRRRCARALWIITSSRNMTNEFHVNTGQLDFDPICSRP